MRNFCPLINSECKKQDCVMWKNGKCLIVVTMEKLNKWIYEEYEEPTMRDNTSFKTTKMKQKNILEKIKDSSSKEIAEDIVAFAKKEFPDDKSYWNLYSFISLYWDTMNIDRVELPKPLRAKIEKAEMLASQMLQKEREQMRKELVEKEKEKLPPIVDLCVKWAIKKGLKSVRYSDIDAFLMMNNIELLYETKRTLYAMVNLKLKTK